MEISYEEMQARDSEGERLDHLDRCIEKLFGHLAPDEVDTLAETFQNPQTRMFEIVHTKSKDYTLMDLFEEIEFKPVVFPAELMLLLRRRDVFLATIGLDNNQWRVLHMSNSYREGEC